MSVYTAKKQTESTKHIVADDMLLTADMPTTAGSKMLEGYNSLFEAEVLTKVKACGYSVSGKANVGEFAIDLLGETSYYGAIYKDGALVSPSSEAIISGETDAVIGMDVNGAIRRAAAQSGLCSVKPTYGTVSRFGTIPVACSGETVSVLAKAPDECADLLGIITGHDDKDGTSLADSVISEGKAAITKKNKILIPKAMLAGACDEVSARISSVSDTLRASGYEVEEIDADILSYANIAWNILMCAELCNNVSRYDGVKYGYRSANYTSIDELYTNSRTEAFGDLLKSAILYGSETLSTENYFKVYDKALRVRRVMADALCEMLSGADALLLPAVSCMSYTKDTVEGDKYLSYKENFYTAPASITGLPAVVAGGVQLVGAAFSEDMLLSIAGTITKEGK